MCGIVGALVFDAFEKKSEEKVRTEANIFITTQLLQATVDRGRDATGVSMMWSDGNYTGLKMGIPSPDFIARFGDTEKDFEGILKLWREYPKLMKVFIGHCRKSSVGNSYDNKNNHPIQVGDTILAHNGTLTNHEKIFDKLDSTRIGDVDSEAIGHLLQHYSEGGSVPYSVPMIKEVTRRLAGSYAVLAMSGNNPFQAAIFRDGRPLEMVLVRPLRTVYIASDKKFLENVLFEYNKMAKLFVAAAKFPYLKKADVEFKTLLDDSCAVWDLTTPVTDDTELTDLYEWDKTPLRVDKIWSNTTTSTYNNSRTNFNNTGVGDKKKHSSNTEVNVSQKKTTGASVDSSSDGLVWSRALNKYKTQNNIEETKDLGAVMVDVDKGEVLSADGEKVLDADKEIKEVDKDAVENLVTGAAEVMELSIKRVEDAIDSVSEKKSIEEGVDSSANTVMVDMSTDPIALKKADEFIDKGLEKYENDEEVVSDLDVSDAAVLRPLPIFALANRIKKFVIREGFIAGFASGKASTSLDENDAKLSKAEKKIRALKLVVKVLVAALMYRLKGNSAKAVEDLIKESVKDSTHKSVDITTAFSVGDLRSMPILVDIKEELIKGADQEKYVK